MISQHETAVVQCIDASHLPFALYLAWQVCMHCPDRTFDVIIFSIDEVTLPDAFSRLGIRVERLPHLPGIEALRVDWLHTVAYARLYLPGLLGARYRRLLYLDCDIHFTGGDLSRLAEVPIGDRTIAMARDIRQYFEPEALVKEFQITGLGPRPFYNSGVIVIDTARYNERDALRRALDVTIQHPAAMCMHDQSMLNIALRDEVAELSPVWNWQLHFMHRVLGTGLPLRLQHFAGRVKPWNDAKGLHDYRHHDAYRQFFRAWLPDALPLVRPRPAPHMPNLWEVADLAALQLKLGKKFAAYYGRFADEWDVKA